MKSDDSKDALRCAVRLLSTRPRSSEELRLLLLERYGFASNVIKDAMGRLTELGYLNDEQLARDAVASKLRNRPIGRRRLKQDLLRKKLPEKLVRSAISDAYSPDEEKRLAQEALLKRIRIRGRPESRQQLKNLYDHLLRLGFDHETIRRSLESVSGLDLDTPAGERSSET